MAGNVYTWSTTAATNASADGDINLAEGQLPGTVNDSARALMAGVAGYLKDNNATLTTGGSANAQTVTSNIAMAALASGLKLRLKAGFTNTGACTLTVTPAGGGAFAAKAIKIFTEVGESDPGANSIRANGHYVFEYDAAANAAAGAWILLNPSSPPFISPACGRLSFSSATLLTFLPYNGDRIRINGVNYAIPAAGITGLANTSVFVGGVAGQNLAASTLYYVYAFINGSTVTADFSTTAHATSSTANNVGVEIKSGDDTRTLIGMVLTNGSSQFESSATSRRVISWFNRRNLQLTGADTNTTTASGALVELATAARIFFITWSEESVSAGLTGFGSINAVATMTSSLNLDTVAIFPVSITGTSSSAGFAVNLGGAINFTTTEASHTLSPYGATNAGTASFNVAAVAMIRG